jgi:hypothetical protein
LLEQKSKEQVGKAGTAAGQSKSIKSTSWFFLVFMVEARRGLPKYLVRGLGGVANYTVMSGAHPKCISTARRTSPLATSGLKKGPIRACGKMDGGFNKLFR